jgi:hypothetical protein
MVECGSRVLLLSKVNLRSGEQEGKAGIFSL